MNRELEEMKKAKEEMENLKAEIEAGITTLKKTAKESAVTLIVRAIVAACASNTIDILAGAFLPKNLRGVAKAGAAVGTFLLPEIIGNIAAAKVENILQEDN